MTEPSARPRVADLVFRVYDRVLHPELFDALALRRVARPGYALTVRLTPTGHVLELSTPAGSLTEWTAARDQLLPAAGVRLDRPVDGGRRGKAKWAGIKYEMSLHAEVLAPEVYAHAHDELIHDAARRGVLAHLPAHRRLGLAPLGYVTVEPIPGGLSVAAFHSFPDEFTVVKTQSLIEFPAG